MKLFKRNKNKNKSVSADELINTISSIFKQEREGKAATQEPAAKEQVGKQQITMKVYDSNQIN